MSKTKYVVRCQECGYLSPQWLGKCPDCGQWNTMVEEVAETKHSRPSVVEQPQQITQVSGLLEERYPTGIGELDRVLGGGLVPGAMVLVGGEPGIGKSTLLLQASHNISQTVGPVLLVSGEESAHQVRMRASRLGTLSERIYILSETDLEQIGKQVENLNPSLLVIDSIQTMFHSDIPSAPGSISQVRECTSRLMQLAKRRNLPAFITGHVTKEGAIAGPRVLEHIVDTVLYFEGERHHSYRIIRAVKNRYGSTNEIGIFEMKSAGLEEVSNPSAMFLAERASSVSGSVVVVTMEGTRPLLVEVQALVTPSYLTIPRRLTSGLDYNKFLLTMAVLERRAGVRLERQDIYVSIAGGVKATEPAVDLGVALAVATAHRDTKIPADLAVFGEIGLSGEIRYVSNVEQRVKEAGKLGFKKIFMPALGREVLGEAGTGEIQIFSVRTVDEALKNIE